MNKNKIKYTMLIVMFSVLLIFSGCESLGLDGKVSGFGGGDSSKGSIGDGSKGLALSFDNDYPPTKGYKDNPIGFSFMFKNYLEHDISDLKIKVSGYDPSYVKGEISKYNAPNGLAFSETIFAARDSAPTEYNNLRFSDVVVSNFQNNYKLTTKFDYCYGTSTSILATVCVPSDTQTVCIGESKGKNKIEKSNGEVKIEISKYPINIKGNSGKKTIVEFLVKNAGSGELRPKDGCFPERSGLVNIGYDFITTLGEKEGECKESGSVNQFSSQGTARITCTYAINEGSTELTTQLTAKISGYNYEKSVKKEVNVVDGSTGMN